MNLKLQLLHVILLFRPISTFAEASPLGISNCSSISFRFPFAVKAGCGGVCGIDEWFKTDYISDKSLFGKSMNLEVFEFSLGQEKWGYVLRYCQTRIALPVDSINVSLGMRNGDDEGRQRECNYAYFVNREWFNIMTKTSQVCSELRQVPRILGWKTCKSSFTVSATDAKASITQFPMEWKCNKGINTQLSPEKDFDESENQNTTFCQSKICKSLKGFYWLFKTRHTTVVGTGLGGFLLIIGSKWLFIAIKKSKNIKLKEKFFKQNGGLLLQRLLNSYEGSIEKCELFNSNALDKATDNFNVKRVVGQGGQGTVYKGMLEDGRIIAVKKSKLVDRGKVEEFIKEVVILSQINHRNVVKMLGCCLETEVPLLVYEFIPNGTLFEYLHDQNVDFLLTWEARLRIAIEVASALAYLHSGSAFSIFHRDIKSANILLDINYRAKVADFGTSSSISTDKTHLSTIVLGTLGYLDPEYFQSSRFTNKSDVYSFGVILVELLTGQKPIFAGTSNENISLVAYFIRAMKENHLYDIIDAQVEQQGKKDEIMAFANLAKRCLNQNGKERPTMKEVVIELERIRTSKKKKVPLREVIKRFSKAD